MDASLILENIFSRPRIPTYNLKFRLSLIVVFFRMVHSEKLFRRSNVKWSISLMQLEKMRSQRKLPQKYSMYSVKIIKFLVPVISEHQ